MMRFERRWAQHLLAAFAPAGLGRGALAAPDEVDYLGVLARMRAKATPLAALGLRLAVWIAALAPLWLWGKLATISTLAHGAAHRAAAPAARSSRVRGARADAAAEAVRGDGAARYALGARALRATTALDAGRRVESACACRLAAALVRASRRSLPRTMDGAAGRAPRERASEVP